MPKINVYLPDDLADAVRDAGIPVSAICQRALEQAVRRVTAVRQTLLSALSDDELSAQLSSFTGRAVSALRLARDAPGTRIGTAQLLHGIVAEGGNLALEVLRSMEIDPTRLVATAGTPDEPGDAGFSLPVANALELAVGEATAMGHNYVGCEHLLIGLAAETDGAAGRALREAGADVKAVRRAVAAALAGYARAQNPSHQVNALLHAVRQEMAPLVRRIEALEARTG